MRIRAIGNAAAFLTSFALVCTGISSSLPVRKDIPVVSEKLEWLSAHGSDYDTLFVGSSRVFHQVMPKVFDNRMKELGHQVRSFNVGADGMNFPETLHMLKLAAGHIPRLKHVVVELGNMQRTTTDESQRSEYWHTPRNTFAVIRSVSSNESATLNEKARLISTHVGFYGRVATSLGRGQEWLDFGLPSKKAHREPIGEEGCLTVERQMSASDKAEFEKSLAAKLAGAKATVIRDAALDDLLADLSAQMKASGIRLIFVKPPAFRKFAPVNPASPVLDFDDPKAFPSLWRPEFRYDPAHLNLEGAKVFSALLADSVAAILSRN